MKYILYYIIPNKISYKMLYETMGITTGSFDFSKNGKSYLNTVYVSYDEYKNMNKEDKLYYFNEFIINNKYLYYMIKNKYNIISIIGVIGTFVFGIISIL